MNKTLAILGSTGSIGRQALDVARNLGWKADVLTAHSNIGLLETQIREFRPSFAVVFEEAAAKQLRLACVKRRPGDRRIWSSMPWWGSWA